MSLLVEYKGLKYSILVVPSLIKIKSLPEHPESQHHYSEPEFETDDEPRVEAPKPPTPTKPPEVKPTQAPTISEAKPEGESYQGHRVGDRVYATGSGGTRYPGTITGFKRNRYNNDYEQNPIEVEHDSDEDPDTDKPTGRYGHTELKPHLDSEESQEPQEDEIPPHLTADEVNTHIPARKMFGKGWKPQHVAAAVGAARGTKVTLAGNGEDSLEVKYDNHELYSERILGIDEDGNKTCLNKYTKSKVKGAGVSSLFRQVEELSRLGFKEIQNLSMRIDPDPTSPNPNLGTMNGAFTWARCGYDIKVGALPNSREILKAFPDVENLSDLMTTPEGVEWWRKNSITFRGTFDLSPNSKSRRVMKYYQEEIARRPTNAGSKR